MLQGAEYQNWYQVLRPIGSFVTEPSRVEILKLADESDLRLRDNIQWSMTRDRPEVYPEALSENSLLTPSFEDIMATAQNTTKRADSATYLSPRLKNRDQEEEIKTIFWNLLKTTDPYCSDDIDVQAIRDFLAKRQAELGRESQEESEDVFDTFGLGLHANKMKGKGDEAAGKGDGVAGKWNEGAGKDDSSARRPDDILAMIDRMVAERTKPIPEKKDMFDKNNPITGKVGFRRDEMAGDAPPEFTDLDEQLDFGDTSSDVDFRTYLVQKGEGYFDSKGNFVMHDYHEETKMLKGRDQKSRKGKSHGVDLTSSGSSEDEKKKNKKGNKGKSKKGEEGEDGVKEKKRTESELFRYMEDLKKNRRHPEWDFPMCNYPKWVHRMYRMDQEKIGQLIKQGMDVPEYCPPWMMPVLDRVWDGKDPKSRGEQPSKSEGRKVRVRGTTSEAERSRQQELGEKKGQDGKAGTREDEARKGVDKGAVREAGDAGGEVGGDVGGTVGGAKGSTVGSAVGGTVGITVGGDVIQKKPSGLEERGYDEGGLKKSFGIDDFTQGYNKEMLALARQESDPDVRVNRELSYSFDIMDKIAEYQKELGHNQNTTNDSERKAKQQIDDKSRKIKERQEAAQKRIENKDKKQAQDVRLKKEAIERKQEKMKGRRGKLEKTSTLERSSIHGSSRAIRKVKKGKKAPPSETTPCSQFKMRPPDLRLDEECMRRFKVLLEGKNKSFDEDRFIKLLKQMPLFSYQPAPPKKTPCERVEQPIC